MVTRNHGRCNPVETNIQQIRRQRVRKQSSPVKMSKDDDEEEILIGDFSNMNRNNRYSRSNL